VKHPVFKPDVDDLYTSLIVLYLNNITISWA